MQTIDTHEAQVDLINVESERLKEYFNALPPEALERPSPCEQWDVGEVIAHLDRFAEIYGGMMERGLRGDLSPTEGFPDVPGTLTGPEIARLYSEAAIDRRRSLGQNLVQAFCERYDWLNDMLKGIGPGDWDKPCYHTARIRPVESFIPTIIGELAIHEWDIRSTQEPSPAVSTSVVPVLMEKIPGNRRPWSVPFQTRSTSRGSLRFRFDLTGEVSGRHDIIVEDGNARLEAAGNGAADVSIDCPSETFVVMMYGRLTLGSAAAAGLVKVGGDSELVSSFDHWLNG